jgi:diguanylate cyclase (GGDEF)-like protein
MLADRDPLTGCVNRRGFEKLAVREVARSDRFGQPLAVRFLDIDRFRQVNDSYGHAAGDLVLAMIGACARNVLRETDVVAHFGGEGFVVLLTDADESTAMAAAERLRLAIAAAVSTIKGDCG